MFNDVDGKDQIKFLGKWNWCLRITLFEKPLGPSIDGLFYGVMCDIDT